MSFHNFQSLQLSDTTSIIEPVPVEVQLRPVQSPPASPATPAHVITTQQSFARQDIDVIWLELDAARQRTEAVSSRNEFNGGSARSNHNQRTDPDTGEYDALFSEFINYGEDDEMVEGSPSVQSDTNSEIIIQQTPELVYSPSSSISTSHSVTPFFCPDCGARFSRYRDYVRRHRSIHEGWRRSYDCHLCRTSLTRLDSLQRHLRNSCRMRREMQVGANVIIQASYNSTNGQ